MKFASFQEMELACKFDSEKGIPYMLNAPMAFARGLEKEDIKELKELHEELYSLRKKENPSLGDIKLDDAIQVKQQKAWKFVASRSHRDFAGTFKSCKCNVTKNAKLKGTPYRYVSHNCKVHMDYHNHLIMMEQATKETEMSNLMNLLEFEENVTIFMCK